MTERLWLFEAVDTFFFRDGAPYHAGEGGRTVGCSLFPPSTTTLQGAIRTALAQGQGWTPEEPSRWPPELGTPDNLGLLELRGPYLWRGEEFLFPMPLLIVGKKLSEAKTVFERLVPDEPVKCDLGLVRLPVLREKTAGASAMEGTWVTRQGLERILAGDLPEQSQLCLPKELWSEEPRVGIGRDRNKRTAAEHMIYSCLHIRPARGVRLAVVVAGIPPAWHEAVQSLAAVRLGGEGRLARITIKDSEPLLPQFPEIAPHGGKVRFTATLVTPGNYGDATASVIKQGPPGLPGHCLTACVGRLLQAGGWDLVNRGPRSLRPFIPAGSTWFYEAEVGATESLAALHGHCPGGDAYGFGQIVIGRWEEIQ